MQLPQIVLALVGICVAIFLLSDTKIELPDISLPGSSIVSTNGPNAGFDPERPETALSQDVLGETLASPALATSDGTIRLAGDAMSFFEPTQPTEVPAEVTTLAEMDGCAFRKPRDGEVIGNVHIGSGGRDSSVASFSNADVARMALGLVRAQKAGNTDARPNTGPMDKSMQVVDVVVTESEAPVYLILQSRWGNVIWNVHKGPNTRIAHIAIVRNTIG